jgi:hypothetical protein
VSEIVTEIETVTGTVRGGKSAKYHPRLQNPPERKTKLFLQVARRKSLKVKRRSEKKVIGKRVRIVLDEVEATPVWRKKSSLHPHKRLTCGQFSF